MDGQQGEMLSASEELARIDALLTEAEAEGEELRRELGTTVDAAAAAVASERGGSAAADASFTEPFRRAGPLLAGAAAARRVPELFVADGHEQLLADGATAHRLGESWLRHATSGGGEPEAERASIIAQLRQRLETLDPSAHERRDALLPLIGALVPLPELWRICVAWRARAPGVLQLPAGAVRASAVAEAFAGHADAALEALEQDLGLLRSFAASPVPLQAEEGRQLGALGLSGTQLANELVGATVVESFSIALDALRTAVASAKMQDDIGSGIEAVEAAFRCKATLFDVACRGGTILHAAGLAAADANDGPNLIGDATAGQLTQTPRESLVPVPTPSSVKTPSAITFRELGPPEHPAGREVADMPMGAKVGDDGVIWPANWFKQRDAQGAWVSEALQWALSMGGTGRVPIGEKGERDVQDDCPAGAGRRTNILRLCRTVSAMQHKRLGSPWISASVRDCFATGVADWLAQIFPETGETAPQSLPQDHTDSGSEKLADLARACEIAATLTGDSNCDAPLLASLWKQYRREASRLASKHANALRTTVLADLDDGQHWRSHRPFLPNRTDEAQARCSYALQMWRFSLASVEYDLSQATADMPCEVETYNGLRSSSIVSDVVAPLLVQTLEAIVNRYVRLTFTRARVFQLQTDVLSIITIVWDSRRRHFSSAQLSHARIELDELCGLLLRSAAVLTAPLQIVLDWLDRYVAKHGKTPDLGSVAGRESDAESLWAELPWLGHESSPIELAHQPLFAAERSMFDPVLEMGKLTSDGAPGEAWNLISQPWFHSREEYIPWAALLQISSPSLELRALLDLLRRRTELRDGDYPALSEADEILAAKLREAIQALAQLAGEAGDAAPEPEPPKFVKAFSDDDY